MRHLILASCVVGLLGCGNATVENGDGPLGGDDGGSHGGDGGGKADMAACVPSCAGRACGDNGCGGSCGGCPQDQLCTMAGQCAAAGADPVTVDVGAVNGQIHDEIYGLAFADPADLKKMNVPLNRWGGNSTTRFNWQLSVHNTGNDYYFENIADDADSADNFVTANGGAGAATLMTIPTIGWTPKDRVPNHPFTCGFPVTRYGAQDSVDPYDTNCGNGQHNGMAIAGDPTNTSVAAPPSFEAMWLAHLVGKFGKASGGGVRFYQMDNEMMLWDSTHRDVHPMPVTYDEVWQRTSDYAPVIRAADPSATLLGYTSWGVLDLFESGIDSKNQNDNDQKAHGGVPLAKWYLAQLAAYEKANGTRLVDCLDLHYYPQGGDPLQTTRSLWDPNYHDPSWIDQWLGEPVWLLPRLGEWIAAAYPGTGVCVSEYNFELGNEDDPKAALVEADLLGIYGKYGVRLAAYWTTPVDGQHNLRPPAQAFLLYRNYDGANGTFAPISVAAASTVNDVVVYAATDGNAAKTTVVVINKNGNAVQSTLGFAHFTPAASAQAYRYVAQNGGKVAKIADVALVNGKLPLDLPALSMTLYVVAKQ